MDVPLKYIKTKLEDYYVLHVKGESMIEAGIPDDSRVLIRRSNVPKNGVIQVVRHEGTSTLKRLVEHEDHRWTIQYEDGSGNRIEVKPGDEFYVQGDFVRVLEEG